MSEDKPLPPPSYPHHHFGPHPHPPLPYGGLPPRPWWGHPPTSEMLYHHLGNEGFRIVDTVYHYLGDIEYLIHLIESLGEEEESTSEPTPVTVDLPKKWQLTTNKYITIETQYTVTGDLDEFTTYRLVHDNYIKFMYNFGLYLAVKVKLHPKIVIKDSKLYLVYPILPGFSDGHIEQAVYQYTDPSVSLGVNKQGTLLIDNYEPQGLYSDITFDPGSDQGIHDSGGAVDFGELTFDYGYIPEGHAIAEGWN
jgi:hypothetical protein